jgi:mitochondrial fission protein ELM1
VGALHQIDSATLRSAASAWHDEFAPLPKPLLVVNIGGPTRNFFIILSSIILLYLTQYLFVRIVLVVILLNYKVKFILG